MKLDNTAYACLARCEQEYCFRHVQHLRAATVDAAPHFGQIVHHGVRALYEGKTVAEAQTAMRERWSLGVEGILMAGGLQAGSVVGSVLDPKCPHYNIEKACQLIDGYAVQWGLTNAYGEPLKPTMFDCVWNEGYAESDAEAAIPDRCVRARSDGKLYALDLKTTGQYLSREWQRSFEHSRQAAIQLDCLEATLHDEVAGFWLDAVHVARGRAPSPQDFVRYGPLLYTRALRAELRRQRAVAAERAEVLQGAPELAHKNEDQCLRWGRLCDYFDVCRADPEERAALTQIRLAKGQWREERWEPKQRS